MLKHAGNSSVQYFTYEVDGQPAGEAQLHGDGTIWAVEIYKPYRSEGHGRRLMDALLTHAALMHKSVFLFVHEENVPALNLYRECGFEVIQRDERGLLMRKFVGVQE